MQYSATYKSNVVAKGNLNDKLTCYNDSIKQDLVLRELFVSDPTNPTIVEPYSGLINVFNNQDMFYSVGLSNEEKKQSVILNKHLNKYLKKPIV